MGFGVEELEELLLAGQNRRDMDRVPIPELGFSAGLWNGDFERGVGLSVNCGVWSRVVPNSFVLKLPKVGEAVELYTAQTAMAVFRVVVDAWEPEWATWSSAALRELQGAEPPAKVMGWATYLSSRDALEDVDAPEGVEVAAAGSGVLVTVGDDPGEVSETRLLAAREALASLLT